MDRNDVWFLIRGLRDLQMPRDVAERLSVLLEQGAADPLVVAGDVFQMLRPAPPTRPKTDPEVRRRRARLSSWISERIKTAAPGETIQVRHEAADQEAVASMFQYRARVHGRKYRSERITGVETHFHISTEEV